MTRLSDPVAISGAGCVLPSGLGVEALWQAACAGRSAIGPLRAKHFHSRRVVAFGQVAEAVHEQCRAQLAPNLQRYCPPAVIWGVSAVRQALAEAGLDPLQDQLRYGLYCSQGGYTHPSLDAYAELLHQCKGPIGLDLCRLSQRVLQERALDPFLVLKSLSNGLLGIVSLALQLQAECNAYMQGVAGNQAALREACAALNSYRIDVAVVVGAGSELDALALSALVQAEVISANGSQAFRPFDQQGTGGIAGEGAVALVLRRRADVPEGAHSCLVGLSAHAELEHLSLPEQAVDLLLCGGSAKVQQDRQLSAQLAKVPASLISSAQPINGILSGAPSLVELVLARSAMQAQCVPPLVGLRQPVDPSLPFVVGQRRAAPLRHCAVISQDDNGFSACYQLEYHQPKGASAPLCG